ncbi:MAG: formate-dependent phosphoribosylglycinamide formyltransferase (GAR transformylase) [Candidatus Azotimanducaceae bacterium]
MARVLIVGRRSACYRAALRLGHTVFLWSSQSLHDSRKERLAGWVEHDFERCDNGVPDTVIEAASAFSPEFVIPATESSVMLAAMLREILGLEGTPVSLADRAHNKFSMKSQAVLHSIPVTPFHYVTSSDSAETLIEKLGLPLVIKPVDESGATDVRVAREKEEVERFLAPGLLAEAHRRGGRG